MVEFIQFYSMIDSLQIMNVMLMGTLLLKDIIFHSKNLAPQIPFRIFNTLN
jgi:hypothetical protein